MRKIRTIEPLPVSEEPTNRERAERACLVLDAYATIRGEIADESDLRDLLADAMHFCQQRDIDFSRELEIARANYEAERTNS